jgi:peptide-methionine (R)-S-oxide reductase
MVRIRVMKHVALILVLTAIAACRPAEPEETTPKTTTGGKIVKSDEEWRKQLDPLEYEVTRKKGTEAAFSGRYVNTKSPGTYLCVCCGQELFSSETKYDSKSGWPSFFRPVDEKAIEEHEDRSLSFEVRTEITCSRCDAHLGHVFPDGPEPTGLRYCVNSASLDLREKSEEE